MISEQNIQNMELDPHVAQDTSGLAEIEQALKEIEELKNDSEEVLDQPEETEGKDESEEQQTEEVEEGIEPVVEKEKKKNKLWKEKRRKYQAIAEKQALYEENLILKEGIRERDEMLKEALNSGTYHYGKSAYADLQRAKDNKKKAIEEGDLDSLLEADVALTKAIHTINDLEKWAYSEGQRKSGPAQYNNYEQPEYRFNEREQEIARDWLEDHEYLDPTSKKYDVNMATKVISFTQDLDANLQHRGAADVIFSEEYFDTINNYISTIKKESQKNSKNSNSVAPVGAVRNSYASSINGKASNTTQVVLTPDEKKICSNLGMSEKEWLKYKLEDFKKGK
jgi:hypothetical protein